MQTNDQQPTALPPETAAERRLKYGANTAIQILVVLVLAVLGVYLAQTYRGRTNLSTGVMTQLSEPTRNLIKNNSKPIRIISFYTRVQSKEERRGQDDTQINYAQAVDDLLQEYKRYGKNIEVETIDPNAAGTKVDQLIDEVTEKYGGEVKKYRDLLDGFLPPMSPEGKVIPAQGRKLHELEQLRQFAADEFPKLEAALPERSSDRNLVMTIQLTAATIQSVPANLTDIERDARKAMANRPPDYRTAIDGVRKLSGISAMSSLIVESFKKLKDDAKVPDSLRKYMAESLPRYEQFQKLLADLDKRVNELPELKLDELRRALDQKDTILVMGPEQWRPIRFEQVWEVPRSLRGSVAQGRARPRFAGEQRITSAILGITQKTKPKVVFARTGGEPLTTGNMMMFGESEGRFGYIAERLRQLNFEVMEKDLSGMWAMQAQMQRMPAPPEPSDDEIKDALWVVIAIPGGPTARGGPAADKLREHLKRGGSALLLAGPSSDTFEAALADWGVKLRSEAAIVHETIKAPPGEDPYSIDRFLREPRVFLLDNYGVAPKTADKASVASLISSLQSLESLFFWTSPVEYTPKSGFNGQPLLPIPGSNKTWGETNLQSVDDPESFAFNPTSDGKGDFPGPLSAGVLVEKQGGGRLIVIGSVLFAINDVATAPAEAGTNARRFPGNAELFVNSVLWLSKNEHLIARTNDINRVADLKGAREMIWRWIVPLGVVPALALGAGVWMFVRRRD